MGVREALFLQRNLVQLCLLTDGGDPGKIPNVINVVSIISQGGVCLGGWRGKPIIS